MDQKWNIGEGGEMPIGFGLSLAANAHSYGYGEFCE